MYFLFNVYPDGKSFRGNFGFANFETENMCVNRKNRTDRNYQLLLAFDAFFKWSGIVEIGFLTKPGFFGAFFFLNRS